MRNGGRDNWEPEVLVCVLPADDAAVLRDVIAKAGARPAMHKSIESVCARLVAGADMVVVSEEIFGPEGVAPLRKALSYQPAWSEVPVLLLAAGGERAPLAVQARDQLDYVLPLERPVRIALLESGLRMALRARRRQRQAIELWEERDRLNRELENRVQALRASEGRFRRLYDANIIGIASIELDRVYEANDLFLQIVGYARAELEAGQIACLGMVNPADLPRCERAIEEVVRTGCAKPFEAEFRRRDGTRIPVLIGGTMLEQTPPRYLCFALDLSERKQFENQVLQAQKLESVGLLAGGIAHDFNNLLTGIIGNASLAVNEIAAEPAERIRETIASAERAAHLIRQLLAYAGKGHFFEQDVEVSRVLTAMADLVRISIPKGVELEVHSQQRIPAVRMDPGQLQQILMNLVINAGEAIGDGRQGKIAVTTSVVEIEKEFVDATGREVAPGRYVAITVRDTGSGIGAEQLSRIFDPFYSTKFTGRGLGLAAVAGIVRSHNGGITVESTPERGATFRVFLPAAGPAPEVEVPVESNGRRTVLVVDDEPSVRSFIKNVLRQHGYRVLSAGDGREALRAMAREHGHVDAVVLDIVMPVMSAGELLPQLKGDHPQLKVLLTSGYSESEARRLCSAYPETTFVQKPYTADEIAAAVDHLFASRNGSER